MFNALSTKRESDRLVRLVRTRGCNVQKASLSATLDELIRLGDELLGENPVRESRLVGDLLSFGVPRDLRAEEERVSVSLYRQVAEL